MQSYKREENRGDLMKMEADIGRMQPQTNKHLEPSEAGRNQKLNFP